jgi:hypothetical protein
MSNPFAELSALIPVAYMQGYIVLMVLLVAGGTILDMMHKKSAKYFFLNSEKAKKGAKREVGAGEKMAIVARVVAVEVLTSGEFQNGRRRLSHLLTMWGFIIFVVTSATLIFAYPTPETPAPDILPLLWHLGAIMLCAGGYWFWFSIRVDVSAEGLSPWRVERADLFILSLLATATFALLWSFTQSGGIDGWSTLFLILFVGSSVVLFGGVYWSKFAHMFFKPAAAIQKHETRADGSRENLPNDYDLSDPATHAKYPDVPTYMGKNPPYMGHGIRRERAKHY